MIRIVVYKDSQGIYKGFKSAGHAGYSEYGSDIVCSAVSALCINTVNSIDRLTKDQLKIKENADDGVMEVHLKSPISDKTTLLMDSLVLGLKTIQNEYRDYIHLKVKEV